MITRTATTAVLVTVGASIAAAELHRRDSRGSFSSSTPHAGGTDIRESAPSLIFEDDFETGDVSMWSAAVGFNALPTISPIADQSMQKNATLGPIGFTVDDAETILVNLVVTATSANPILVPHDPAHLVLGGSGGNRTLTVTPAADEFGITEIGLTVDDGEGGVATTSFSLTVNDPPVISNLADALTQESTPPSPLSFTIGDAETPTADLGLSAVSDNPTLVANHPSSFAFGGAGANRTLTITPVLAQAGVATITVIVDDGRGGIAADSLTLFVNAQPVVGGVADTSTDEDVPLTVDFVVTDAETLATDLVVSASSDNPALVPNDPLSLSLGGTGSDRSLTVTPAPDASGNATITVSVQDTDGGVDDATFSLVVNPVNDPPSIHFAGGAQRTREDRPLALSTLAGNLLSVSDLDAGMAPVELTLVTNGSFNLDEVAGLSFVSGSPATAGNPVDGLDESEAVFTGTLEDINRALDGMTLTPPRDLAGASALSLQVAIDDLGNTGGGSQTDTLTVDVDVTDEPEAGHVVLIGHDFYSFFGILPPDPEMQRIVGNSVFLASSPHPVAVLGYDEYADLADEAPTTDLAIAEHASSIGRTVAITRLSSAASLGSELPLADVLVIYEQEQAPAGELAALGATWAQDLRAFLDRDGVIIVCEFNSDRGTNFLGSAGLLDATTGSVVTSQLIALVDPADPVAQGVSGTYVAPNGSSTFATSERNVVSAFGGEAHVVHKRYGAPGDVVLIGHDFLDHTAVDPQRLVGNAAALGPDPGDVIVALVYDEFTDPTERTNSVNALFARLQELDRSLQGGFLSRAGDLAAQLPGFDLLVILDQELMGAGQGTQIGALWAPTLRTFLNRGGVVVSLDGVSGVTGLPSNTFEIVDAAGLLDVSAASEAAGDALAVEEPLHPVVRDVMDYNAPVSSVGFTAQEGTTVIFDEDIGRAAVLHTLGWGCGEPAGGPGQVGWQDPVLGGCWYTGLRGQSCEDVCIARGGFDVTSSIHTGTSLCKHFWPDRLDAGTTAAIEAVGDDGCIAADGSVPVGSIPVPDAHPICSCFD